MPFNVLPMNLLMFFFYFYYCHLTARDEPFKKQCRDTLLSYNTCFAYINEGNNTQEACLDMSVSRHYTP